MGARQRTILHFLVHSRTTLDLLRELLEFLSRRPQSCPRAGRRDLLFIQKHSGRVPEMFRGPPYLVTAVTVTNTFQDVLSRNRATAPLALTGVTSASYPCTDRGRRTDGKNRTRTRAA